MQKCSNSCSNCFWFFVVKVTNFIAAKLIMCKLIYTEGAQSGAIHLAGTKKKAL